MDKRIDFTAQGLERIRERIEELNRLRPEVLKRLQTAREMGDLSENGAYKAARWELGGLDRELRKLTYLSRVGRVREKPTTGVVGFGSVITLENEKTSLTFTLVSGYESDPKEGKLSVHSPYGAAVLGKKAGDRVLIQAPAGEIVFTIVSVN